MKHIKVILTMVMITMLSSCAAKFSPEQTRFTTYNDFRKGPEGGVDLVWANPKFNNAFKLQNKLKQYDSIVVDQIVVVADENTEADDEQIRELSTYIVEKIKQSISPYKQVVERPKNSSLRLSIALSNIETPNPVLALTSSVLPFGIAMSSISKVTTGSHTNVGQASIELLVSDAKTGEQIFAAIDTQKGNKDLSTIINPMDDARDAVDFWIERLQSALVNWKHPKEKELSISDIFSGN